MFDQKTSRTAHLPQTDLFRLNASTVQEQTELSYKRARAIAREYALTANDVLTLTDKFWDLHMDKICMLDGAATTLLSIQYNLAAGTLAPFALKRPELRPLLKKILRFDVSAQFLLTELAHGLDALNLETTATYLDNGEFDLHTPNDGAAKFMPPTGPFGGIPRVAIVFARLIVKSEDRGIRPFVVPLGDGKEMCTGITARVLPTRSGSKPVDHALTYFNHVRIPREALLGKLERPYDIRMSFFASIWRVTVGSLALSALTVPTVAVSTYIAAKYSHRRHVAGHNGQRITIWSFRTQQLPILHSLAEAFVTEAFFKEMIRMFRESDMDFRVKMGLAACAKAAVIHRSQSSFFVLAERCGAHGLFEYNQIIARGLEMRGVSIAEGDVLALSIRLATELLLERYEMPASRYPSCLLAKHEKGLFEDYKAVLSKLGDHRSPGFSKKILPICQSLVAAIGHRMAYEAAVDAGVAKHMLNLYEAGVVKLDAAWYAEHVGLGHLKQAELEEKASDEALKCFETDLESLNAAPYSISSIISDDNWDNFVSGLDTHNGNAKLNLLGLGVKRGTMIRTGEPTENARL